MIKKNNLSKSAQAQVSRKVAKPRGLKGEGSKR
jgi:hypothetical protein